MASVCFVEFVLKKLVYTVSFEILYFQATKTEKGSLFGVLNHVCTPFGRRKLIKWISYPLGDIRSVPRTMYILCVLLKITMHANINMYLSHIKEPCISVQGAPTHYVLPLVPQNPQILKNSF